jgi:HEPN domain-containing protein
LSYAELIKECEMKKKNIAVVDWQDFRKQSQLDIAACNLLYKAGDYGNAAYHLQQAVEKHTKYILLHGKLMPEGKKLICRFQSS